MIVFHIPRDPIMVEATCLYKSVPSYNRKVHCVTTVDPFNSLNGSVSDWLNINRQAFKCN